MADNRSMHAKVVSVSHKDKYRRAVPKTYSYRYEISADAGPAVEPLVRAGAVIIEGRYRGRVANFKIGKSVTDPTTYQVKAGYVHPLEENPMAYPPRSVEQPDAQPTRTPGFASAAAAAKLLRPPTRIERPRIDAKGASSKTPRPTSANDPAAYRKTG